MINPFINLGPLSVRLDRAFPVGRFRTHRKRIVEFPDRLIGLDSRGVGSQDNLAVRRPLGGDDIEADRAFGGIGVDLDDQFIADVGEGVSRVHIGLRDGIGSGLVAIDGNGIAVAGLDRAADRHNRLGAAATDTRLRRGGGGDIVVGPRRHER